MDGSADATRSEYIQANAKGGGGEVFLRACIIDLSSFQNQIGFPAVSNENVLGPAI